MTTTGMQHGTETVVEWLRDVSRALPARYYMIRDDIAALVDGGTCIYCSGGYRA